MVSGKPAPFGNVTTGHAMSRGSECELCELIRSHRVGVPMPRVSRGRQTQDEAARPGAQKSVSKLSRLARVLHWRKGTQSVSKPCPEMPGQHIPGPGSGRSSSRPCAASGQRRQGNQAPAVYLPRRSAGLALRGIREFGPLPSGSPKNPSRIRISPVKQKGRFPALFARCTFAPTFREVSGGSEVQPAWALGLR